jgi:hypothetical protein
VVEQARTKIVALKFPNFSAKKPPIMILERAKGSVLNLAAESQSLTATFIF